VCVCVCVRVCVRVLACMCLCLEVEGYSEEKRPHGSPRSGWRTCGTWQSMLYLPPPSNQRHCNIKNMPVYTHLTALRLYANYNCYQIIKHMKSFYQNWERCEVLTWYVSLGRQPGGD